MLSAAKLDAFIHASQCGCEPGIPLVQSEAIDLVKPPGVLSVECPAGCGVRLAVPLEIVDIPSIDADLDVRFVAKAPELHDYIYTHLQTCPSPRPRSVEATLHKAAG